MIIRFRLENNTKTSIISDGFDNQDCQKIINLIKQNEAIVVNDTNQSYKKYVIDINNDNQWIYQKISKLFVDVNINNFDYSINGIIEPLEMLELNKDDFIEWHNNIEKKNIRKLAGYVWLTTNYSGGLAQELSSFNINDYTIKQGQILILNPFLMIRINKINDGNLYLMRGWVSGPKFR